MLEDALKEFEKNGKAFFKVKIKPVAGRDRVEGVLADGTIKISIAAPAENGRANRELLRFLAEEFGLGEENLEIKSGRTGRSKLIKIKKI